MPKDKPKDDGITRVLSLDGGGVRGIMPAMWLARLEQVTGRKVSDLFDLVAGTSTGGILACAIRSCGTYHEPHAIGDLGNTCHLLISHPASRLRAGLN